MKHYLLKEIVGISALSLLCGCARNAPQQTAAVDAPGEITTRSSSALVNHPLAPKEFRRPDGWKRQRYPLTVEQISEKYSEKTMKKAAETFVKMEAVNSRGKWKPTPQSIDSHKCPEWFLDAKFGIFFDWGLWSIPSWAPKKEQGAMYPDWYEQRMYSNFTPKSAFYGYKDYHVKNWGEDFQRDDFIPLFRGEKFDAEKLVQLFKQSGAKYVVPFNKHHSGFCLWDSSFTLRSSAAMGPRRDFVKEIVKACAENDMKFGFYFSIDEWEAPILKPDGTLGTYRWGKMGAVEDFDPKLNDIASGKIAVKDFIKDYIVPQAIEFIDKYSPDIVWYDADWAAPATYFRTYDISAYFYNVNEGKKEVAVNDRYGRAAPEELAKKKFNGRKRTWLRTIRGDFFTDEFGDTSAEISVDSYHPWEACRGISQSYGNNWQDDETNVVTSKEFINMFADMVARGGNLLLIVNPDGQGGLPEIQKRRLLDIGGWLAKNGEAIYATRMLAPFHCDGAAYTRTKDGKFGFAILKNPAKQVELKFSPVPNAQFSDVATGAKIEWKYKNPAKKEGAVLTLPDSLAKSELPVAVKFNLK